MTVVKDVAYKTLKALLLSFPYSNHLYTHYHLKIRNAFRRLETIISSSWWCTNHLRIDNLSAAVVTVGKGDNRTYTDAFCNFKCIITLKCNRVILYSGHEKGNVERKVCYTRNNWFTTAPIMESFPNSHSG